MRGVRGWLTSPFTPIWGLKSYPAFLLRGAEQEGQVGLQIPNRGEGERGDFSLNSLCMLSLTRIKRFHICAQNAAVFWPGWSVHRRRALPDSGIPVRN